jgi:hypothetical protein
VFKKTPIFGMKTFSLGFNNRNKQFRSLSTSILIGQLYSQLTLPTRALFWTQRLQPLPEERGFNQGDLVFLL